MAASKKPQLSKPPFWGGEAASKKSFAKFGFFEAAILYIFPKLIRTCLRTSEKLVYLRCVNTKANTPRPPRFTKHHPAPKTSKAACNHEDLAGA